MDRRTLLSAGALVGAGALSGCLSMFNTPERETDDYDVGMTDSAFDPATIEVSVGEIVVWQNTSGRAHTVTAYEEQLPEDATYFASGDFENEASARTAWKNGGGGIVSGDRYEHTFETAGEHPYFCIPHERVGMAGTVVVTE